MDLTGQPAPTIDLPRDGGTTVSLAQIGGPCVVFFYPRADTPGCTREAVEFTDRIEEFVAAGVAILGVSKDPVAKQEKFRDKHGLSVPLLSDADGDVCERYGTWVEKNMYGKKSMGIERSTFLIDGTGTVVREWRKVKVDGHVDEVLEAARAL
ncbi:peroxiredoxin [Palleronia rufa]|uniref:peroxiredoxin n=1 Tax=Palleronia rufa TaxID=1530186 RepID=UPI00055AD1F6|nr:peroxiredoxin [Palleronia rufa]